MGTQFHVAGGDPREERDSECRAADLIVPDTLMANALDLQVSSLAGQDIHPHQYPSVYPQELIPSRPECRQR